MQVETKKPSAAQTTLQEFIFPLLDSIQPFETGQPQAGM
jgi:hypothetical protein